MKKLLLVLILFSSLFTLGQNRKIHVKNFEDASESLWYSWRIELCSRIDLDTIQNTQHNWYFRLWTNNQALDIWEDSKG